MSVRLRAAALVAIVVLAVRGPVYASPAGDFLSQAQSTLRTLIDRLRGETMPEGIAKTNGRIEATQVLGRAVRTLAHPPPVWVQMSTAHLYGDPPQVVCTEESPSGVGLAPTVDIDASRVARRMSSRMNAALTPSVRSMRSGTPSI